MGKGALNELGVEAPRDFCEESTHPTACDHFTSVHYDCQVADWASFRNLCLHPCVMTNGNMKSREALEGEDALGHSKGR